MNSEFFVEFGKICKIVRETPKTLFYREVKPSKYICLDDGIVFMSCDKTTFRKYSLDNITLEGKEHRMPKKQFLPSKVIEPLDIERVFFENTRMIIIDEYMEFYHLFLHEEDLLEKAFILRKYVLSLTSQYMKKHVFDDNNEYVKGIYNKVLTDFKTFYTNNKDLIDYNIDKIKYTIYRNFDNDFEKRLKEANELQPVV